MRIKRPGHDWSWPGAGAFLLVGALLLPHGPEAALGQEAGDPEPMSKSQIVRQLATAPNQQERLVERIEEACLTFDPTPADIADFHAVGAEPAVIEAVRACASQSDGRALTAELRRRSSAVGAGDTATIVVRLQGESRSPAGVSVHVASAGEEGGRRVSVQAADTTDRRGRATLRVPAARRTGTDSLLLSSPDVSLRGDTLVILGPRARESTADAEEPAGDTAGESTAATGRQSGQRADGGSAAAKRGAERLRSGRPLAAAGSYRRAVDGGSGSAGSWAGLGRAWLAAGYPARARRAAHRAVDLAPESEEARETLDRLRSASPRYRLTLGGGRTVAGPQDGRAVPLRMARIDARPAPALHLWAGYDDALGRHLPALMRGGEVRPEAAHGGLGLDWGPGRRLTTRLEAGRRKRSGELAQLVYRAEQEVRLGWGGRPLDVTVGGLLGRWYDRDDWLVYGQIEVPVSSHVRLRPRLSFGTTVGTAFPDTLRRVARDARAGLAVDIRPSPGLRVVTRGAFGKVRYLARARGYAGYEDLATSGPAPERTLVDLGARASGRLLGSHRVFLDLRHQRPPFGDPFTAATAGLTLGLP